MRRPPLWEAGAEAQQQKQLSEAEYSASRSSLQPALRDRLPDAIDLPVEALDPRPMRKSEQSLVVCS